MAQKPNKIYIAGPMTGKPQYNVEAFRTAEQWWKATGHTVLSPIHNNDRVWTRLYGRRFDWANDKAEWCDASMKELLQANMDMLFEAEGIALLPGYEKSFGTKFEILVGQTLGLPFFDAVTGELLKNVKVSLSLEPSGPITKEALSLVYGDRQASYGHPYDDYVTTSRLWEAVLSLPEGTIGPKNAALMMALVKVSRESRRPKRDNLTDLAGYAECAYLIQQRMDEGES